MYCTSYTMISTGMFGSLKLLHSWMIKKKLDLGDASNIPEDKENEVVELRFKFDLSEIINNCGLAVLILV